MSEVADQPGENDVESEGGSDSDEEEEDEGEPSLDKLKLDDQAPDLHDNGSSSSDNSDLDSSEEDTSDSDSESLGAPSTIATTARARPHKSSSRVHNIVADDLAKQKIKTESKHHTRKGLVSAGKMKGSKWKASKTVMVNKGGDKSGWS